MLSWSLYLADKQLKEEGGYCNCSIAFTVFGHQRHQTGLPIVNTCVIFISLFIHKSIYPQPVPVCLVWENRSRFARWLNLTELWNSSKTWLNALLLPTLRIINEFVARVLNPWGQCIDWPLKTGDRCIFVCSYSLGVMNIEHLSLSVKTGLRMVMVMYKVTSLTKMVACNTLNAAVVCH